MSEEMANVILNEIRAVKEELHEEIKGVKEELHEEIKSVKEELHQEINGVRNEMLKEIKGVKEGINSVREEINGVRNEIKDVKIEVNILRDELVRNSEQHVMIFEAINEIKEKVTHIEQEQESYKKKQAELTTEIKAQDELITDCQKRSLVNKFDIENLKEKLAG